MWFRDKLAKLKGIVAVTNTPRTARALGSQLGSSALRYGFRFGRPDWPPARPAGRRLFRAVARGEEAASPGPTARSAALARLEAVLFIAREPLSSRKLAQLADLADGTEARTLVRALNRLYDSEGRAFRAVEVADVGAEDFLQALGVKGASS